MAEVAVTDIRKRYRTPEGADFHALRGVTLTVRAGESFALLGPSGCGKSTLLRVISGLETPDSGAVAIGGRDMTAAPPEKRPTAMVFQNYALFPHLTVEGNVAFGLKLRRVGRDDIRRKVGETLELLGLGGLGSRRVGDLSGGQQQRVALARALAIGPSALLLDEPLSNLDAELRVTTREAIRRIQTELRLTLIYVTHDQEEAMMISDRMAVMRAGEVLEMGAPEALYARPGTEAVARFLGRRNMIRATVLGGGGGAFALGAGADGARPLQVTPAAQAARAPGSEPWTPSVGAAVWLALRPGECDLYRDPMNPDPAAALGAGNGHADPPGATRSGSAGGWPIAIQTVGFAGDHIHVGAALEEGGQQLRLALQPARAADLNLKPGDRALLTVPAGSGMIYPADPAAYS